MTDPKAKDKGFLEKLAEDMCTKAVDKFLDPVLNYTKEFCSDFAEYLGDFDENVTKLGEADGDLNAERKSLQNKVERAELSATNMKESPKVKEWYRKVEAARREAATLLEKGNQEEGRLCLGKWCFGRLCYGKNVVKCCKRLNRLREEGNNIKEKELLEQGTPDSHDHLSNIEDKFRNLGYAITDIEELQKMVGHWLKYAEDTKITIANDYEIHGWLKKVTLEVNEGKSYKIKEEDCIQEFQSLGSGSTSGLLRKVERYIDRIAIRHSDGKKFLDNLRLAVGSGASCSNEASPQPQPQPQPQLA